MGCVDGVKCFLCLLAWMVTFRCWDITTAPTARQWLWCPLEFPALWLEGANSLAQKWWLQKRSTDVYWECFMRTQRPPVIMSLDPRGNSQLIPFETSILSTRIVCSNALDGNVFLRIWQPPTLHWLIRKEPIMKIVHNAEKVTKAINRRHHGTRAVLTWPIP